jgi:hypothetical protein
MTDPALQKQIDYLEKLLTDLRSRFYAGDRTVEGQIRATAAKLEMLKLNAIPAEEEEKKLTVKDLAKAMVNKVTRKCCRG